MKKTSRGSLTIRAFKPQDAPRVKRLIDRTLDVSYRPVYSAKVVKFFKEFHSTPNILADAAKGSTIVVQRGGRILGTGTLLGREIRRMFVNPSSQGKGLGRKLMAGLERRARRKGLRKVELYSSLVARRFYLSLGFRPAKNAAGSNDKFVFMTKRLSSPRAGVRK